MNLLVISCKDPSTSSTRDGPKLVGSGTPIVLEKPPFAILIFLTTTAHGV